MFPQPLERIPGRFCCDNPRDRADPSSDRQSVGSNVGADVDNDCSRRDHMPVGGNHFRLEAAEKEDRKIDAFAKIELPPQAAAPAEGDRASPYRPPSAHHDAPGNPTITGVCGLIG
jgi:hypothetical protein